MIVQNMGFNAISFSPPATPQEPQVRAGEEPGQQSPPSFHCRHAGCTKVFRRKEHLNRHVRSHEPTRPHKCYMCNKSFARKDILHRHVLLHNAPPGEGPKRTLLACKTCRRRKIRCDYNVPCSACESSGVRCVRTPSSSQNLLGRLQQQPGGVPDSILSQEGIEEEEEEGCEDDAEAGPEEDAGQDDYFGQGWNDKQENNINTANTNPGQSQFNINQPPLLASVSCSSTGSASPKCRSRHGSILQTSQCLPTPSTVRPGPGTPMMLDISAAVPQTPMSMPGQTPTSMSTHGLSNSFIPSGSYINPRSLTATSSYGTPWSISPPVSGPPSVFGGELHWQTKSSRSTVSASLLKECLRDVPPTPESTDVSGIDDLIVWMNQVQNETYFHGLWPLLHLPTLSMETATPALVQSLGHLQDWIQQKSMSDAIMWDINESHMELLQSFIQGMSSDMRLSSSTNRTITLRSFQTLQALGLIAACAITGNNPPNVFEWVEWCAAMCIAYLRQMGVFEGARKIDQAFNAADDKWIMDEQFNRLAANFLRIDAYLGLILGRAPTLRWSEMRFTFPASDVIWRAAKPEERRVLLWHEPAGRYSTSFRTVIREGLVQVGQSSSPRPRHLLMDDYNLALCAFSSDVWEVAQEARYHDHRSYRNPSTDAAEGIRTWQSYLLDMRRHMEMNHDLESNFFARHNQHHSPSSSSSPLATSPPPPPTPAATSTPSDVSPSLAVSAAALSLTLYHMLHLNMVADMPVLETAKCCEECQDVGLPMRMRMWASGPDARRAVVHAAQLRRVYERETATSGYASGAHLTQAELRISNPLRDVGLFNSAVVLCSYAQRGLCLHLHRGMHTHGPDLEPVELARPEVGGRVDAVLERWVSEGDASCTAGVALMGLPLCPCSLGTLTAWYREQFVAGSAFAQRFSKFEVLLPSLST